MKLSPRAAQYLRAVDDWKAAGANGTYRITEKGRAALKDTTHAE